MLRRGIVLSAMLLSTRAEAQSLELRWDAPPECPTRDALLRAVRDAGAPEHPRRRLVVQATVRRATRWRAVIVTDDGVSPGERTLESRTCARLTQGVAMVVALALEAADEAVAPQPPTGAQPARPEAPPVLFVDDGELPPALRPRPRPRPVQRERVRVGAAVRASVDVGLLPAPSPGLALELSVGVGAWWASVEAGGLATRQVDGPRAGTRVDVGAWRGAVLACGGGRGTLSLGGCAGVEGLLLDARATGFLDNRGERAITAAGLARVWAAARVSPWLRVALELDASVPFERPRYEVEGVGALHEPAPVSVRAGLAVRVAAP